MSSSRMFNVLVVFGAVFALSLVMGVTVITPRAKTIVSAEQALVAYRQGEKAAGDVMNIGTIGSTHPYRSPLDECFDVPLREAADCDK